jgi:hypothetical protein
MLHEADENIIFHWAKYHLAVAARYTNYSYIVIRKTNS